MSRAKLLLGRGYFPSQLPPSFSTRDFASKAFAIRRSWRNLREPILLKEGPALEIFSVARAGHARRTTAIPNPVTQFRLSEFVATHWRRIEVLIGRSTISLSKPNLVDTDQGRRAINLQAPKFLMEQRLLKSPGYKFALVTDISQFFPTLYTHSIPWAIYGKANAKRDRHRANIFGNKLDALLQRCQSRQTLGIPIGPDTSHVVAEIVGAAIDRIIVRENKSQFDGYRYVDDFVLFFRTADEASAALSVVEGALREFELKINPLKTKIVPVTSLVEDAWTHSLRAFEFASARFPQKRSINHFFDLTFSLAASNADENVVKFALRKLSAVVVKQANWPLLQAHLCRAITTYPNCIREAAHLYSTYRHYDYQIDDGLRRTLNLLIAEHAPIEHHSEVAWALWMCKQFRISLSTTAASSLKSITSSVCTLLALDLRAHGLLEGGFDRRSTRRFATPQALYEKSWLVAYEGGIRNWIYNGGVHIAGDPFFDALRQLDVHFYDPGITLQPLFVPKPGSPLDPNWFDSDNDPSAHFEFTDLDEEYQDPIVEIPEVAQQLQAALAVDEDDFEL